MARAAAEDREEVEAWERLEARASDLIELAELAAEDPELAGQSERERAGLDAELNQRELSLLFSDPYADHGAVVSLTVGQGGVDAQDWVEMLLRMYTKWAAPSSHEVSVLRPGCSVELLDTAP